MWYCISTITFSETKNVSHQTTIKNTSPSYSPAVRVSYSLPSLEIVCLRYIPYIILHSVNSVFNIRLVLPTQSCQKGKSHISGAWDNSLDVIWDPERGWLKEWHTKLSIDYTQLPSLMSLTKAFCICVGKTDLTLTFLALLEI